MGYLINDDLIWVITPKCASNSIETALLNSNLNLKKYNKYYEQHMHMHIPLNDCFNMFGKKESVCITRDWFEKWLSSLNFIWDMIELHTEYEPLCKWEDVDNETIYSVFNNEFVNKLYSLNDVSNNECFLKLLKVNDKNIVDVPKETNGIVVTLISENYWKSDQKCTYEFDIKELGKFVNFIELRFGEKLVIERENTSTKRPNKIIVNDELKNFVWEKFEKKFKKRNELI
jgi:hypothetical protein